MGMYTELIFGAKLKSDTPEDVIETLKYMVGVGQEPATKAFETKSGHNPLRGGSFYFGVTNSVTEMKYHDIGKAWQISSRANIKNYENEIEDFLEWIKPHIDQGSGEKDMYAITIHEEIGEPTIYYLQDED